MYIIYCRTSRHFSRYTCVYRYVFVFADLYSFETASGNHITIISDPVALWSLPHWGRDELVVDVRNYIILYVSDLYRFQDDDPPNTTFRMTALATVQCDKHLPIRYNMWQLTKPVGLSQSDLWINFTTRYITCYIYIYIVLADAHFMDKLHAEHNIM